MQNAKLTDSFMQNLLGMGQNTPELTKGTGRRGCDGLYSVGPFGWPKQDSPQLTQEALQINCFHGSSSSFV